MYLYSFSGVSVYIHAKCKLYGLHERAVPWKQEQTQSKTGMLIVRYRVESVTFMV
jgi:hypothetical protein